MRIAVIAPSFRYLGGQSVQAEELIKALKRLGVDAFLVPIDPMFAGPFKGFHRIRGIRTLLTQILYWILLLRSIPKSDAVHISTAAFFSFCLVTFPAVCVARLSKKRIILNYHSGEAEDHLKKWKYSIRFALKSVDMLVVPSEYLKDIFQRYGYTAHVIPNIVDFEQFTYRERTSVNPRFISTRNLEPLYRVADTIRAFSQIQKEYPEASLDLVGTGSELESLKAFVKEYQLRNVTFSGRVEREKIPLHLDQADIFLNSSRIDNQPISILEAFASGLPVITTPAGGIPDLVQNGVTGLLVESGKPHELAEKAIMLLKQPEYATKITKNALEQCHKYHWRVVAESFLSSYDPLRSSDHEIR